MFRPKVFVTNTQEFILYPPHKVTPFASTTRHDEIQMCNVSGDFEYVYAEQESVPQSDDNGDVEDDDSSNGV
jgi:hypothetical protein